ncbi:hypothetical protein GCM10010129_24000 [Streptomyces fumigatiscleroticus]|nr:hypothetical protein GCM10010129_24000 [Streptomyces fumigatiscleroticus]
MPLGREIGGGRIDDVAVPPGYVAGAEVAVDGVEHDGPGTVDIALTCCPDVVVTHTHLHIICIKPTRVITARNPARTVASRLDSARTPPLNIAT